MRILHVVPAYYPAVRYGGPIRSVHGLAAALVRQGHEVSVYTTNKDGNGSLDVPLGVPVLIDGVNVHYFDVPALRRLFWSPSLSARLKRDVRLFDVVHVHSLYLCPNVAATRAARLARIPYIVSPRGMLVRELIRRKSRWVKTAWINLIERREIAGAAALHVTTDLEAVEARALGLRLPRIFCLPNGVETPDNPLPLQDGPYAGIPMPYGLFLSRINWKKGLDRLIAAWKWVPMVHLVVAGNDEEGYRAQMETLARKEGVESRVHFIGEVSDEHKWALYAGARVFILPSYSENFGNVVGEAMAMACPVIVTKEVGIAPLVTDSDAGTVVPGDPEQLGCAIEAMHTDEPGRLRMGRNGQRAARTHMSWDSIAGQMAAVYAQLASGAAGADR